jgi:hypothetical protein
MNMNGYCIAQNPIVAGFTNQSENSVFIDRSCPLCKPSTFIILNSNNSTDWHQANPNDIGWRCSYRYTLQGIIYYSVYERTTI